MDKAAIEHLAELWGSEITRETGKEITMRCPFAPFGHGHKHKEDQNPNFSITISEQRSVCYCFSCSNGGSVQAIAYKLWQEADTDVYKEAYHFAKKAENGMFIPTVASLGKKKKKTSLDKSLERVLRMSRGKVSPVLKARGITQRDIKKWDLGFDELRQRDIFPIFNHKKKLVALTGRRILAEDFPKYYHYGVDPAKLTEVYYGEQLIDPTVDEAILVEGPTDAIKVSRYYPNVLGQCGVHILTTERLQRLKRWFQTLTLLYDGDSAGSVGMFKVGLALFKYFTLFVAFLPKGLDPFDASSQQIKEAMKKRILWSLIDWGAEGEHAAGLSGNVL